jgi:type IV secretion system protein VirD4
VTAYAIALVGVLIVAGLCTWAFLPAKYLPANRVRSLQVRLHLRLHPGKGFAGIVALWLRWGRLAALRRSARIRRSLSLWQRVLAPGEHSVFLGRAQWRHGLRVPLEEHVLVMAPPRTFKTAFLADVILRYPGPVIATTTKADVLALTGAVRARRGPVHVFNPQYIGGVPSTFCWSPVDGCEDPATAIRRADAFAFSVSRQGVEDGSFWSAKASDYLRGYFHAAALAGYDMRAVAGWVSGADAHVPEQILAAAGARQWALTLAELRSEAHKTAATVRMVMSRAISFMADPALAASVLPVPGHGFDIGSFLRDCGTVYMIAEAIGEDAPVAPLFAAMATEIHYIAALAGQASPSGRLDPPLLMGLDEVTQICPVPLPAWLSDSGGKGIQVVAVVHGEAQLAGRWDDHGRQVVWDTSSVKVFLPGITDTSTLEAASVLCGQAQWKVRGEDHATVHSVASPDMIRQLPAGFALVIRGGCAPVIARLPRAWNNPAYRSARRRARRHPALAHRERPFLSAEPATGPDPGFGPEDLPGFEPEPFPDYPPPGWAAGHDDRSFPWS